MGLVARVVVEMVDGHRKIMRRVQIFWFDILTSEQFTRCWYKVQVPKYGSVEHNSVSYVVCTYFATTLPLRQSNESRYLLFILKER